MSAICEGGRWTAVASDPPSGVAPGRPRGAIHLVYEAALGQVLRLTDTHSTQNDRENYALDLAPFFAAASSRR